MLEVTFLVGHRGTGKTSLLQRLQSYYAQAGKPFEGYDLDEFIENQTKRSIEEIFAEDGESFFREQEVFYLRQLLESLQRRHEDRTDKIASSIYISLGAGYEGDLDFKGSFPEVSTHVLWVKRPSDTKGRVFLDRPSLEAGTPLDSYFKRFSERESRYKSQFTQIYLAEEGWHHENPYEKQLLGIRGFNKPRPSGRVVLTALPIYFKNEKRLSWFFDLILKADEFHLELRDDLLSFDQIQKALEKIPPEKILISLRKAPSLFNIDPTLFQACFARDLAVEIEQDFDLPSDEAFGGLQIRSLHQREKGDTVRDCIHKLESKGADLHKLAIPVDSYDELLEAHRWFFEKRESRVFCPVSKSGRWVFYRQHWGGAGPLHFVHLGLNLVRDQSSLFDHLKNSDQREDGFACILGDPVAHSHTPSEHHGFFKNYGMNVYRIPMSEDDFSKKALAQLKELGMRFAAVTSPLKKRAYTLCDRTLDKAKEFESVNTLAWSAAEKKWVGTNTDIEGLSKLALEAHKRCPHSVLKLVWGGGGTRPILRRILGRAYFMSARTGALLNRSPESKQPLPGETEAVVFWAVGRNRHQSRWPEIERLQTDNPGGESTRVKLVVDLNYSEDSPGKEYALKKAASYLSGEIMFKEQAEFQRKFWINFLR
jgi:shikimate 5-dehydrogenase